MVSQRQTLREYSSSSAVDLQLRRHYRFVVHNDNVHVCATQIAVGIQKYARAC